MTTPLLVIDAATIRALAKPDLLIGWMREAMIAVSARDVELPLRRGMPLPDGGGAIGMMPGFVGGQVMSAGVKVVSLVPPERRKGSSHLGLMVLYDADGLVPRAILCGATVTALRTAAATAMATDVLARGAARSLAILGTGEQAVAHITALRHVRPFDDLRIWGRRQASAGRLAETFGGRACATVESAVAGADVVCTVTSAHEPILAGAHISEGAHVNLVGSSVADAREVDDDLVERSRYFVDYRPSTMDQAGEFLHALAAGRVGEDHIAGEIGAVLSGEAPGRQSAKEITVYKSLGVAAQDIVTARHVYTLAMEHGLGATVAF